MVSFEVLIDNEQLEELEKRRKLACGCWRPEFGLQKVARQVDASRQSVLR